MVFVSILAFLTVFMTGYLVVRIIEEVKKDKESSIQSDRNSIDC